MPRKRIVRRLKTKPLALRSSIKIDPLAVPISEQEAKAAHYSKMMLVAELIVAPVPDWLLDVLSHFSFDVRSQENIDSLWQTRKEMWDTLVVVSGLASDLYKVLQTPNLAGFLKTNSQLESEERLKEFSNELIQLSVVAAEARKSNQLVRKSGSLRSGAEQLRLRTDMPPKYLCAAIIIETVLFLVESGHPRPPVRAIWNAADLYWKAWPRDVKARKGWGSDPMKGWQRYFKAIDDERLIHLRREVRRYLTIGSRGGI